MAGVTYIVGGVRTYPGPGAVERLHLRFTQLKTPGRSHQTPALLSSLQRGVQPPDPCAIHPGPLVQYPS